MKVKKALVLCVLCFGVMVFTGCMGGKLTTEDTSQILYDKEMSTDIDIQAYKTIIEEILTYQQYDDKAKALMQEKYASAVDSAVFLQLEALPPSGRSIYPGVSDNVVEDASGEYPIYDESYNIVSYGSYEEHIESVKEFNAHELNRIESIEAAEDRLIVKIDNKYNGVIYLYATLTDGKITYVNLLK